MAESSKSQQLDQVIIPEKPILTLDTPNKELIVMSEIIVNFENLKDNGCDLTSTLDHQGWNGYFDRLKGPTYPIFVKEFWVHASTSTNVITSFVFGRRIIITEKTICDLISQDKEGLRIYGVQSNKQREAKVMEAIFKKGSITIYVRIPLRFC